MSSALFSPIKVGEVTLSHRVALAALTRLRSDASSVHSSGHGYTYYTQRTTPGGLLITEATPVHPKAGGMPHAPGITTDAQIAAWKKVRHVVPTFSFSLVYLPALRRLYLHRLWMVYTPKADTSSCKYGPWVVPHTAPS